MKQEVTFRKTEVGKKRNYDCILIKICEIALHIIISIDLTTILIHFPGLQVQDRPTDKLPALELCVLSKRQAATIS